MATQGVGHGSEDLRASEAMKTNATSGQPNKPRALRTPGRWNWLLMVGLLGAASLHLLGWFDEELLGLTFAGGGGGIEAGYERWQGITSAFLLIAALAIVLRSSVDPQNTSSLPMISTLVACVAVGCQTYLSHEMLSRMVVVPAGSGDLAIRYTAPAIGFFLAFYLSLVSAAGNALLAFFPGHEPELARKQAKRRFLGISALCLAAVTFGALGYRALGAKAFGTVGGAGTVGAVSSDEIVDTLEDARRDPAVAQLYWLARQDQTKRRSQAALFAGGSVVSLAAGLLLLTSTLKARSTGLFGTRPTRSPGPRP